MYQRTSEVINKTGIHARPAAAFTRLASKFQSAITIKNRTTGKAGNAKSIVIVMSLALSQGTPIEISAEGDDEQQAVDTLIDLVESGLEE